MTKHWWRWQIDRRLLICAVTSRTTSEKKMRPTKYNSRILEKATDYITNYNEHGHAFPSLVGLSRVLGIARSTLNEWQNDADKFELSDTLEQIKDQQHLELINKGIKGEFNASITKLMLHNFGYSDKKKIENNDAIQVVKLRTNFDDYTDEESRTVIGRN